MDEVGNNKNGKADIKIFSNIGIFTQIILIVLLIYFLIIYLFIPQLYIVIEYILSFLLFVMSYNNLKIYKRKGMTITYFIVGIILLVTTIITAING